MGARKSASCRFPLFVIALSRGLKRILEPIFKPHSKQVGWISTEADAHEALSRVARAIVEEKTRIIDLDLASYLDPSSYCPHIHEVAANRLG